MRLDRYLAKSRIVDLSKPDLKGCLQELINACTFPEDLKVEKSSLLRELVVREKKMTTCLGNGIALPHLRVPMKRSYIFAVGRCLEGVEFEDLQDYRDLKLIFLLIANEKEKSYLKVLASLARVFQDKVVVDRLANAIDIKDFKDEVMVAFGGAPSKLEGQEPKFNRVILRESEKIARGAKCTKMVFFGSTFSGKVEVSAPMKGLKKVLISGSAGELSDQQRDFDEIISVPSYSNGRLGQLRSAILIGLTRGVFKYNDRLCCIGGLPRSDQFDAFSIIDVEKEFHSVFTKQADMLPSSVKPEVMERVLAIAMELAVEGREGHPVGCLFVLGDTDKVKPHTKPLILNPFYGYKGEDRNVLNPFMDETVKELSLLDGAFIIRGDGVMDSAGTLIHVPEYNHQLPGGLGSRHAAAGAISLASDCISLVVSSSGQITLFRRGEMLPLMSKQGGIGA